MKFLSIDDLRERLEFEGLPNSINLIMRQEKKGIIKRPPQIGSGKKKTAIRLYTENEIEYIVDIFKRLYAQPGKEGGEHIDK